jgi:nudix-type nucleoside diphosphatase (YffH/AdpP family)
LYSDKEVRLISRKKVLEQFFDVEELVLKYPGSDKEVKRFRVVTQKAAAILLHNPEKDTIILSRQFRIAALDDKESRLLEIPAGVFDKGENAEECAKRETEEETGYEAEELQFISRIYTSPGYTSEKIDLFYATVNEAHKKGEGGGLPDENEHIEIVEIPFSEAIAKIDKGEISDAKTIIALLWLDRQKRAAK